jgi:hypothetical protein
MALDGECRKSVRHDERKIVLAVHPVEACATGPIEHATKVWALQVRCAVFGLRMQAQYFNIGVPEIAHG